MTDEAGDKTPSGAPPAKEEAPKTAPAESEPEEKGEGTAESPSKEPKEPSGKGPEEEPLEPSVEAEGAEGAAPAEAPEAPAETKEIVAPEAVPIAEQEARLAPHLPVPKPVLPEEGGVPIIPQAAAIEWGEPAAAPGAGPPAAAAEAKKAEAKEAGAPEKAAAKAEAPAAEEAEAPAAPAAAPPPAAAEPSWEGPPARPAAARAWIPTIKLPSYPPLPPQYRGTLADVLRFLKQGGLMFLAGGAVFVVLAVASFGEAVVDSRHAWSAGEVASDLAGGLLFLLLAACAFICFPLSRWKLRGALHRNDLAALHRRLWPAAAAGLMLGLALGGVFFYLAYIKVDELPGLGDRRPVAPAETPKEKAA